MTIGAVVGALWPDENYEPYMRPSRVSLTMNGASDGQAGLQLRWLGMSEDRRLGTWSGHEPRLASRRVSRQLAMLFGILTVASCSLTAGPGEDSNALHVSATGYILAPGDTAALGATRAFAGQLWQTSATGRQQTWPEDVPIRFSSESPEIARIDAAGIITAVSDGKAVVWVEAAGLRDTATVVVSARARDTRGALFSFVQAGRGYSCALKASGMPWCWGDSWLGQIGAGSLRPYTSQLAPGRVAGSVVYVALGVGGLHTCALNDSGRAFCWGDNAFGQLGDGSRTAKGGPVPVRDVPAFRAVSAGDDHSCGLTDTGSVVCWGRGVARDAHTADGVPFVSVTSGSTHRCALTGAGVAYCWGSNTFGQLGTASTEANARPVAVSGGARFSVLSAGTDYTCGITLAGEGTCWGLGLGGRLGTGSEATSLVPARVVGGIAFASIDAGTTHTCAVAVGGNGYCWGQDLGGPLGDGPPSVLEPSAQDLVRPTPSLVLGGLAFLSISAGSGGHSCGVTFASETYCWGDNRSGALGYGKQDWYSSLGFSIKDIPTPVAISP